MVLMSGHQQLAAVIHWRSLIFEEKCMGSRWCTCLCVPSLFTKKQSMHKENFWNSLVITSFHQLLISLQHPAHGQHVTGHENKQSCPKWLSLLLLMITMIMCYGCHIEVVEICCCGGLLFMLLWLFLFVVCCLFVCSFVCLLLLLLLLAFCCCCLMMLLFNAVVV